MTAAPLAAETSCIFCEIVEERAPATIVERWNDAIAIVPLNPVVQGHLLVIPTKHVADFTTTPFVSAQAMFRASELVAGMGSYNLITSKGKPATQSVFHLHLHLVPRTEDDGLALPWYSGRRRPRPAVPALLAELGRVRAELATTQAERDEARGHAELFGRKLTAALAAH